MARGGDGRADSLKRPQSGALDVIVEGAQRGEDRVREGQHVIARDAIKPSGGVFVQAAKMSSQTGRGDGREGLRRRRGEVGQALEEHIPPWFIKLGCSTPVRGPEGSKPFNGGIRMGIGDGLSDSQPSEVMSEAVKPSLVIRHRHDREAVGLPGNGVRGEQGFSTMGGDATSTKVITRWNTAHRTPCGFSVRATRVCLRSPSGGVVLHEFLCPKIGV